MQAHPFYLRCFDDWILWRLAYLSGRTFIETYTRMYSIRENPLNFAERKEFTYCPAYAKTLIEDIRAMIISQFSSIRREPGTSSFDKMLTGQDGGVDLWGSSMDYFMADKVLTELLVMGRVGVFVDMPTIEEAGTIYGQSQYRPYLYTVPVENIRNWKHIYTPKGYKLQKLVINVGVEQYNDTAFPTSVEVVEKTFEVTPKGVTCHTYCGEELRNKVTANLDEIPFVIFSLSQSLMTDIARYQVALLNMASSDVHAIIKNNFPIYTEQYDANSELAGLLRPANQQKDFDEEGSAGTAARAEVASNEVALGATDGRRYPKGLERPQFISPSSEPLKISHAKQDQLKREMKELVRLTVTNLRPTDSVNSALETKRGTFSDGILTITKILQNGEQQIANLWSKFEHATPTIVNYPSKFQELDDLQRQETAKNLFEKMESLPSLTYQKEIAKQAAQVLLQGTINSEKMDSILDEIEQAKGFCADSKVLVEIVKEGICSHELAAEIRCFPPEDLKKAQAEHLDRVVAIAEAQGQNDPANKAPAARGVNDLDADPNSGKKEKDNAENDPTKVEKAEKRGEGK